MHHEMTFGALMLVYHHARIITEEYVLYVRVCARARVINAILRQTRTSPMWINVRPAGSQPTKDLAAAAPITGHQSLEASTTSSGLYLMLYVICLHVKNGKQWRLQIFPTSPTIPFSSGLIMMSSVGDQMRDSGLLWQKCLTAGSHFLKPGLKSNKKKKLDKNHERIKNDSSNKRRKVQSASFSGNFPGVFRQNDKNLLGCGKLKVKDRVESCEKAIWYFGLVHPRCTCDQTDLLYLWLMSAVTWPADATAAGMWHLI